MWASNFVSPGPQATRELLLITILCLQLGALRAQADRWSSAHSIANYSNDGGAAVADGYNSTELHVGELFDDLGDDESALEVQSGFRSSRSRKARQLPFVSCPTEAVKTRPSSNGKALVRLYSVKKREDVEIYQRDGGWRRADFETLVANGFDLNRDTIIYSHGYLQGGRSRWLLEIRQAYDTLFPPGAADKPERYNLLVYDWHDYALGLYGNVAANAPYLGNLLGEFLDKFADAYSYDLRRVHFISFSLSTHISGLTGRYLKSAGKRLGKITALDPTGVCFQQSKRFANQYTLRADDADMVVSKHYDWGGLGSARPTGGIDILVNGGDNQPEMSIRLTSDLRRYVGLGVVDHNRATDHEASLPLADCQEVAYACPTYEKFMKGNCGDCGKSGDKCYLVSTFAANSLRLDNAQMPKYPPNSLMHISTGTKQFCVHHYQIVLRLTEKAAMSIKKLVAAGGLTVELRNGVKVNPNHAIGSEIYTQLLRLEVRMPKLLDKLEIDSKREVSPKELVASIKHFDVKYMSNISPKERAKFSGRFCPASDGLSLVRCATRKSNSRKKTRVGSVRNSEAQQSARAIEPLENNVYFYNDQPWPFNWRVF